jgi:hypothetical protein
MSDLKEKIEQEVQNELRRLEKLKRIDDENKAKQIELENKKRRVYVLTKELVERFAAEVNLIVKQEKSDQRRYDIAYGLYEKRGFFSRKGDLVVWAALDQKHITEGYHGVNVVQVGGFLQIGGITVITNQYNIPSENELIEQVNNALTRVYALWKVKKSST